MHIRCTACGATLSLEVVVEDPAAAQALQAALEMSPIGGLVIRYLALHRPAKTKLTWPRVASLLGELLPAIRQERLTRDGRVVEAPMAVWSSAIEKVLAARDAGALRTPLKGHGYLFEVVVAESARHVAHGQVLDAVGPDATAVGAKPMSATAQALSRLEQLKRAAR